MGDWVKRMGVAGREVGTVVRLANSVGCWGNSQGKREKGDEMMNSVVARIDRT